MNKKNLLIMLPTLLISYGIAVPSFAASQGTLGATSTGSANISITKSVQAQISDIQDMTLSNWSVGDGAVTLFSNVCVYSSTGNYKVTATGNGSANAFTIASNSNTIAYTVKWNGDGAGNLSNTGTSLTTGSQSSGFTTASTTSTNCGGSANNTARVIVNISSTAMDNAASSSTPYTGTLTMLVTPY